MPTGSSVPLRLVVNGVVQSVGRLIPSTSGTATPDNTITLAPGSFAFDLTVLGVGVQGPPGPQGEVGPAGPAGADGSDATVTAEAVEAAGAAMAADLALVATTGAYGDLTGTPDVAGQVSAAIDALVAGAPGALDTLNELAAAIGDDADFAATITAALAAKANSADLGTAALEDVGAFDPAGSAAAAEAAANAYTDGEVAALSGTSVPPVRGALVVTLDDGYASWDDVAALVNRDQRLTFFVMGTAIGVGLPSATLSALHATGHEIGGHAHTDVNLTSLSVADRVNQYENGRSAIEAVIGAGEVKSFAYPQGGRNATTDVETYLRFDRVFGIAGQGSVPIHQPGRHFYGRHSWTASTHQKALALVRQAAVQPLVVNLYTHDPGNTSGSFAGDPSLAQVAELLDLAYSLSVPVLAAKDALPSNPFGLVNGGFESDLTGWDQENFTGGNTISAVTDTPASGLPGTKSAKLTTAGSGWVRIGQVVPVEPSTNYSLTLRVRTANSGTVRSDVVQYDAFGTALATATSSDVTAASWTQHVRDVTTNAGAAYVVIRLANHAVSGDAYVDHVHWGPTGFGKLG